MTSLTVTRTNAPGDEWDAFVRTQAHWTAYHLAAWQRTCAGALGHETIYLEAREPATRVLHGVLPLVRVRSALFGHFLVSMPFVNYGGPLGSVDAIQALVKHAEGLATQDRVDLLELRSRTPLPIDLPASHRKVSVLLDLTDTTEALFKSFPAKLRSQVRRPQKEGVTVRMGPEVLPDFFRVFSEHMRDLGTPTHGSALFNTLSQEFGNDAWIAVAYLNNIPIACGLGFRWAREFEITWASSLREHSRIAPNMLLYWELMQRAVAEGCSIFNFGRCTPDSNTHRFKLQWGGRDETLYWYQRARGAHSGTPSPDAGPFSYGPRIWRKLPLAIANSIGPRVVRLIP